MELDRKIFEMVAYSGLTLFEMAEALGVGCAEFDDLFAKRPTLINALEAGREVAHCLACERALLRLTEHHTEMEYTKSSRPLVKNGKVVHTIVTEAYAKRLNRPDKPLRHWASASPEVVLRRAGIDPNESPKTLGEIFWKTAPKITPEEATRIYIDTMYRIHRDMKREGWFK